MKNVVCNILQSLLQLTSEIDLFSITIDIVKLLMCNGITKQSLVQIHPVGLQSVNGTLILRQDSSQAVAISSVPTTVVASPRTRGQSATKKFLISMQTLIENDDKFIRSVVFSDEAIFHLSGKVNKRLLNLNDITIAKEYFTISVTNNLGILDTSTRITLSFPKKSTDVNSNREPCNAVQSNHQLRMDAYTFPELADMVICYGEARGNERRALNMYQQQFQNKNHPHHTMFARLYQRLRDDGSLRLRRIGGRPRRHLFSIHDYTELKGKVSSFVLAGRIEEIVYALCEFIRIRRNAALLLLSAS
ncbi:hypothetical protein ANN_06653 [Periplaneta americana]|uniref:DUF4817 domain-containing protein n=1 Tax=Periplaneta americana TaxID=6978 RepID=A0ABQ8TFR7_PERAM|nr:hypothetical protein ANN_06653 [Periplaneta americana]